MQVKDFLIIIIAFLLLFPSIPIFLRQGSVSAAQFGEYSIGGTTRGVGDSVEGSVFTADHTGQVDELCAYIRSRNQANQMACAIYTSDGSTLLGYTEERVFETDWRWQTFNFSTKPSVTTATDYLLVFWGNDSGDCLIRCGTVGDNNAFRDPETYSYPSFPEPHDKTTRTGSGNYSIYANVTELSNLAPSISSPSPGSGATGVDLYEASVSVTIEDTEGNEFNWTIEVNTSDSASANFASNGTKTCSLTTPLTWGTTYTWWVNTTDWNGSDSWTNTSYTFTAENHPDDDTNYYMSNTTGKDSNNGTHSDTPWENISYLNSKFSDGTITIGSNVYFKRGDNFTTNVIFYPETGGTPNNPMIIGAYGTGNKPILANTGGTTIDELRMDQDEGNFIFQDLNLSGGNSHAIQVRPAVTGINNITFRRLDIYNFPSYGIIVSDINYLKVENCTIGRVHVGGVQVVGDENNPANNGTFRNLTIKNCKTNADGISIHLEANEYEGNVGSNWWIENCTIDDCDEAGIDLATGWNNHTTNVLVDNVYISNCTQAGVAAGHWSSAEVFQDVHIFDCGNGFLFTRDRDVIVRDSIVEGYTTSNNAVVINQNLANYNCSNITFYNCNFISDGIEDIVQILKQSEATTENLTYKNCIFYSRSQGGPSRYIYYTSGTVNLTESRSNWTYNMWHHSNGLTGNHWEDAGEGLLNWANWLAQPEVWQDLRDNPEFVDDNMSSYSNYDINNTSPCIDAGDWLTQADGAGTSERWVTVDDANYFFDGISTLNVAGDTIFVGSNTGRVIQEVNYENKTIQVDQDITWSDNDDVSLNAYNGSKIDIGAKELASTVNYNPVMSAQTIWNLSNASEADLTASPTEHTLYPHYFNCTISDSDGNTMNLTFRTNESGAWLDADTNTSLANGTYYCINNTWVNTYTETYYISYNLTDGTNWVNNTYSFTTLNPPNRAPTQTGHVTWNTTNSEEKALNATDVNLYPTSINVTLGDADNNDMNLTFRTNESGAWLDADTNTTVGNGTYACINTTWAHDNDTVYYISFNLSDGHTWTNKTYQFTTHPLVTAPYAAGTVWDVGTFRLTTRILIHLTKVTTGAGFVRLRWGITDVVKGNVNFVSNIEGVYT